MSQLKPENLFVYLKDNATSLGPIPTRKYTLTHSDETGHLFLTIGSTFAWEQINKEQRDEVLGQWQVNKKKLLFHVDIYLDNGEFSYEKVMKRNEIFRRELSLALQAIRYGDAYLFTRCPALDYAIIIIHFHSSFPPFCKNENWGNFIFYSF